MERKSRAQTESFVFLALIAAALVFVNLLSIKYFRRVDLTKRGLYSLSDGTRRVIGGLRDELSVTVYFTPGQPPPANDDERALRDQLEEYRNASAGRVAVRWVVPDTDQKRRDAEAAGCTKRALQAVNVQEQQASIQEVYRCVAVEFLGRRDKLDFVAPGLPGFEYDLTSLVKKLTTPEAERNRAIGFLTGHGELTPDEGMPYLAQLMERARIDYTTRTVNLSGGDQDVPNDIKGLIILNPTRRIEEKELRKLDAYLMRGGSIAVWAGGLNFPSVDPMSAVGSAADHHLNDWLQGYGLKLESNVVLDPRAADGMVNMGGSQARVRIVTWPEIIALEATPSQATLAREGGLDPAFPAVFRLPLFTAPYPSTVTIDDAKRREVGGTTTTFAWSSPDSVARTTDFDLNLIEIMQQGQQIFVGAAQHGPYRVGVAIQGRVKSAFAGRPAEGAAAVASVPERAERDARLMLVSAGAMYNMESLRNQVSGGLPPAIPMLFNTFDYLAQDTDLLAVRAKEVVDANIRGDVSKAKRMFFQWGSIVGLPLLIGLLGLGITSARRSQRAAQKKHYLA